MRSRERGYNPELEKAASEHTKKLEAEKQLESAPEAVENDMEVPETKESIEEELQFITEAEIAAAHASEPKRMTGVLDALLKNKHLRKAVPYAAALSIFVGACAPKETRSAPPVEKQESGEVLKEQAPSSEVSTESFARLTQEQERERNEFDVLYAKMDAQEKDELSRFYFHSAEALKDYSNRKNAERRELDADRAKLIERQENELERARKNLEWQFKDSTATSSKQLFDQWLETTNEINADAEKKLAMLEATHTGKQVPNWKRSGILTEATRKTRAAGEKYRQARNASNAKFQKEFRDFSNLIDHEIKMLRRE